MLDVAQALSIVLEHAKRLPPEMTALSTPALGQVLAVDIAADLDSPPFDKSMMDGYAVRAADCKPGVELKLVEEIQAGAVPKVTVNPGECSRIFTGAPIPAGADAVVMKEKSEIVSEHRVRFLDDGVTVGRHIVPRGREMKTGDVILPQGTVITPATFGLFASVGKTAVPCFPPARVAVLATGNEVVEPNAKPKPGQIRNSNGPMLMALSARAGALPRYIGIASDEHAILKMYLEEGIYTSNVMLVAGGVSAGKYDLVPSILESMGVTIHFHHIRMKPGKPLLFGTRGDKLIFGLPGNPVSGYVGFELFVRPALRMMAGHAIPATPTLTLPLAEPLSTSNDRPTYHPAFRTGSAVRALPWFGSADLRAMLNADSFLCLPAGDMNYPAGQMIDVLPL
jgi:molybdopterin molybdotransferase